MEECEISTFINSVCVWFGSLGVWYRRLCATYKGTVVKRARLPRTITTITLYLSSDEQLFKFPFKSWIELHYLATRHSACKAGQHNMNRITTNVDQKLLRTTKFPPEFNQKVDTTKINIPVIKK